MFPRIWTLRLLGLMGALALGASGLSVAAAQDSDSAQGDESEARMHFRLGRAYHDSGRFVEAAREFEEAYRQSPERPELLYNVFVAHRDAGNVQPAAEALREYLRLIQGIDNRDQLESRLASMDRTIAQAAAAAPAEDDASPVESDDTASETASASGGVFVPGFVIAGIGVAAMAAGAITGFLALEAGAQLERDYGCNAEGVCEPGFESAAADGGLLAGLTDGLLFGGLGVATLGIVLALVIQTDDASETAGLDPGLSCDLAGCTASLRGRF